MPRIGVTKEAIIAAAEAILLRNDEPTLDAVRAELGNTGSKGTLAPVLRAWRAERADSKQVSSAPIPDDVQQQLNFLGGRVWSVAIHIAEANLAPQRDALAREKAEAQRSVDELQAALYEQEIHAEGLEEARRTADEARKSSETAQREAVGQLVAAGAAKERAEMQLAAALKAVEETKLVMDRLERENKRLEAENEALKKQFRKAPVVS